MKKRTSDRRKAAAPPVDPERHERLCTVCSHPEREAIEEAFVHCRTLSDLDLDSDLPSEDAIYRHAHALGLFEQRNRNMRYALENIIARSESATVSADSIIRAIRACSCLTANGECVEPATTHRVIASVVRGDAHPPIPLLSIPNDGSETLDLTAAPEEEEENPLAAETSKRK